MIVTIDGPAGAGKSTAARHLARHLGFRFLDTGAMYRAVAHAAINRQLPWHDVEAIADLARHLNIQLTDERVVVDGVDVTDAIRRVEVTTAVKHVADNGLVRKILVEFQRQFAAAAGNVVTEGRDQGTVAFPRAECKFFLTASPDERARRRMQDLERRGDQLPFDVVLAQQDERDQGDAARPIGAMIPADDAIEVRTDGLSREQVVQRLAELVQKRR